MTGDKEALILTLAFETIMGEVTGVRPYSRVAPYIDQAIETWGNTPADVADLIVTADKVRATLSEAYQMIDMTIMADRPTVGLLLERDIINALNGQMHLLVEAKGRALVGSHDVLATASPEEIAIFEESLSRLSEVPSGAFIGAVSGRAYYRDAVIGLATKLNVSLREEESS